MQGYCAWRLHTSFLLVYVDFGLSSFCIVIGNQAMRSCFMYVFMSFLFVCTSLLVDVFPSVCQLNSMCILVFLPTASQCVLYISEISDVNHEVCSLLTCYYYIYIYGLCYMFPYLNPAVLHLCPLVLSFFTLPLLMFRYFICFVYLMLWLFMCFLRVKVLSCCVVFCYVMPLACFGNVV